MRISQVVLPADNIGDLHLDVVANDSKVVKRMPVRSQQYKVLGLGVLAFLQAEYTINQGVSPTLLFPLTETPFKHFRAFYPTYGAIYQLGVFISRSSLPFIRVRTLYTPAVLQVLNLIGLTAHAMYPFIPTVWFVFAIVFWEGLLGGLVYVSTFAAIREEVAEEDREFSLGATTVSDSAGICLAGFVSIGMEKALCGWQVQHGRDRCRKL